MRLAHENTLLERELMLERGVRELPRVGVVGERRDVAEEEEGGEGLEGRLVRSVKSRQSRTGESAGEGGGGRNEDGGRTR